VPAALWPRRPDRPVAVRLDRRRPGSALAVYAHPDDPEVSCGGTLARWVRAGTEVHLVLVNRGEKGSMDSSTDADDLAAIRAKEVDEAAGVLGLAGWDLLGLPDGESENDLALREDLVRIVRRVRPEVVVCPDPAALYFGDGWVNHRDHRVCGFAVLDAVAPASASPLYFPETGPPHQVRAVYLTGTLEPDTAVSISDVLDVKAAALACHRSQIGTLGEGMGEFVHELIEQRAAEAGKDLGVKHAELFRVLRLTA
jgi:LmbE family N-acetylglucosaminyl deacetylase